MARAFGLTVGSRLRRRTYRGYVRRARRSYRRARRRRVPMAMRRYKSTRLLRPPRRTVRAGRRRAFAWGNRRKNFSRMIRLRSKSGTGRYKTCSLASGKLRLYRGSRGRYVVMDRRGKRCYRPTLRPRRRVVRRRR